MSTTEMQNPSCQRLFRSDAEPTCLELIRHCSIRQIELILQRDGFAYTFIIAFTLMNFTVFFLGATPAWSMQFVKHNSVSIRLAGAVARGGGALVNLNTSLAILVAAKSLMTYLRKTVLNLIVPFDKAMPAFHSLVGNALLIATVLHVLGHVVRYSKLRLMGNGFYGFTSLVSSGVVLTVCIIAMKLSSLESVRKKRFETFHYVHGFSFAIFAVLLLLHGSHNGVAKTWMYVIGPLVVYCLDKMWRLCHEKRTTLLATRENVVIKGSDVVCLKVPRSFSYIPGQYCDIQVPMVSNWQWHPFSIASAPHESEIRFYIKVNGDWTKALYNLFKETDFNDIHVYVRGPYGAPAQHVGQYERVILISGGVGATPMCSISRYAHHWILNYARREGATANTLSTAFTRNQNVSESTIIPCALNRNQFDYATERDANAGDPYRNSISRNQQSHTIQHLNQKLPRTMHGPGSVFLEKMNFESLGAVSKIDRVASAGTNDEVNNIAQEQKENLLYGFKPVTTTFAQIPLMEVTPYHCGENSINIPGIVVGGDTASMKSYSGSSTSTNISEDYEEKYFNPFLPNRDCQTQRGEVSTSVSHAQEGVLQQTKIPQSPAIVQKVHCLIDLCKEAEECDEDKPDSCVAEPGRSSTLDNFGTVVSIEKNKTMTLEDGLKLEMRLMYDQYSASDAYKMMGMSSGPLAMIRYLNNMEGKRFGSSTVCDSINMMQDSVDESLWPDRMLFCLQSVTINWFLVWLMLIRFSLIALGNINQQFTMQQTGLGIFTGVPFNTVDLLLALIITIPVAGAISIEIYMYGLQVFLKDNVGNSLDIFLLIPLLIACIGLHCLNLAGVGGGILHVSKITVFAIWPVLSLVLIWRIARTVGSRVMLAQYSTSTHAKTKSFDYIWVSRTHEEDSWCINELLPLADSNVIRLHRFITKDKFKNEGWEQDYEHIPLKTTYSRPNWDDVFGNLVNRSKSGAVIGIFFCGPNKMAKMIQSCASKAMAISTIRAMRKGWQAPKKSRPRRRKNNSEKEKCFEQSGETLIEGVLRITSNKLHSDLAGKSCEKTSGGPSDDSQTYAPDPTAYGCGVRLIVRVENFT